jgi:hypothetical protein
MCGGSSTVVPASWRTFRDTWGLYTLHFSPQWVAGGGTDDAYGLEGFTFLDPSQGAATASVHIDVFPITPATRPGYCQQDRFDTGTTFHAFQVKADPGGDWAILTEKDYRKWARKPPA